MRPWAPLLAFGLALTPLAVLHPVRVSGASMEPTLHDGDLRLGLRAWCAGQPKRGQVWLAAGPEGAVIKRVVGLPGEHLEQRDGSILLEGRPLDEPCAQKDFRSLGPWDTGEGYLVLGDNRPKSRDGRAWGMLNRHAFRTRLLCLPN